MKINILSLFDGMSCAQLALQKSGVKYDSYFASEIEEAPIKVTQKNWPATTQLGDVKKVTAAALPPLAFLFGGSPCQGFSYAGGQLNFCDPRSALFFEFARVLKEAREINPGIKFLFENVKMKREWVDVITRELGVGPVLINSALVSAQTRSRLYWTNIAGVTQPADKNVLLRDILEEAVPEKYFLSPRMVAGFEARKAKNVAKGAGFGHVVGNMNGKSGAIVARYYKDGKECLINDAGRLRRLTPVEVERLQTVPDNYTAGVGDVARYKMLGNGWTVDVISHIISAGI